MFFCFVFLPNFNNGIIKRQINCGEENTEKEEQRTSFIRGKGFIMRFCTRYLLLAILLIIFAFRFKLSCSSTKRDFVVQRVWLRIADCRICPLNKKSSFCTSRLTAKQQNRQHKKSAKILVLFLLQSIGRPLEFKRG